jgi:hypothetical protein
VVQKVNVEPCIFRGTNYDGDSSTLPPSSFPYM